MAKAPVKKQITLAREALREIMQENLAMIGDRAVAGVVSTMKARPYAERYQATKEIDHTGIAEYRVALLEALAELANEALAQVRREVPKAKTVKLSEFSKLPPDLQRRLKARATLTVETQLGDLDKIIVFQYMSSVDSTDSYNTIRGDLNESLDDFLAGQEIAGAAGILAAETVNSARNAFFMDPDVSEELDALEFVNEDPVTEICNDLAGTIFAVDDPEADRYGPPLHFNCKSWIRPVLKGDLGKREVESLKPSSKKIEDTIQLSECGRKFVVDISIGVPHD